MKFTTFIFFILVALLMGGLTSLYVHSLSSLWVMFVYACGLVVGWVLRGNGKEA